MENFSNSFLKNYSRSRQQLKSGQKNVILFSLVISTASFLRVLINNLAVLSILLNKENNKVVSKSKKLLQDS